MRQKFLWIMVTAVILILGWLYVSTYLTSSFLRAPSYNNTNTCNDKAKLIIEQRNLSPIHSCDVEEVKYGSEKAYIVSILYGIPRDTYSVDSYIVFENNTPYHVRDEFHSRDVVISSFIRAQLKVPIIYTDIKAISTKELVNYNGDLALKYSFFRYVHGDLYMAANRLFYNNYSIEGNITPTEMTIEQAHSIAVEELRKKGYEPISQTKYEPKYKDNFYFTTLGDEYCWDFIHLPVSNNGYNECSVIVCLDGKTNVDCK